MLGDGDVTYPSDVSGALIPYKVVTDTYDYFESRNYINDVNQQYTQVLASYDENGKTRETYTYGYDVFGNATVNLRKKTCIFLDSL